MKTKLRHGKFRRLLQQELFYWKTTLITKKLTTIPYRVPRIKLTVLHACLRIVRAGVTD